LAVVGQQKKLDRHWNAEIDHPPSVLLTLCHTTAGLDGTRTVAVVDQKCREEL